MMNQSPSLNSNLQILDPSAYNLTQEQLDEIRRSFNVIDINGDGRLSVREVMKAHQALGHNPTLNDIKKMVAEIDENNSGYIELHEYVQLMAERYGALEYEGQMMKAAFHHFDRDGSGYLSKSELRKYLTRCGDKLSNDEFERVIGDIDIDGDGKIDLKEFTQMLTRKMESSTGL